MELSKNRRDDSFSPRHIHIVQVTFRPVLRRQSGRTVFAKNNSKTSGTADARPPEAVFFSRATFTRH